MHEFTEEILYWTRTAGESHLEGKDTVSYCMPACQNNTVQKKNSIKFGINTTKIGIHISNI